MIILARTAIVTIIPMVGILPQTEPTSLPGPMGGFPLSRIELSAPAREDKPAERRERLDELFTLPETDLEQEIGAF